MAAHFLYKQLPASGLGNRDPRRSYATGGISGGTPVFITCLGDHRDPLYGLFRDPATGERFAIFGERIPIYNSRPLTFISDRMPPRIKLRYIDTNLTRIPAYGVNRSTVYASRTPGSGERTPPDGSRNPPDNDVC